ncbi:DUF445 domain-containing protein [Peptacetobacter sp.]|uniref:DUF445 domain-containing protein n=1 Tax=Peptacetobacter sp. TaxID=2991975 RepID=UPI002629B87B|nr:DUF445 family protein [Peptacetobacter sp.]
MNIFLRILFMAVIGGFIGYLTNVLAIKMLFKPYEAIKIPIINFEIRGLIPKRKEELAKNVAETVKRELLNEDDIFDGIIKEEDKKEISEYINSKIKNIISEKAMFLPSSILSRISDYISDIIDKEVDNTVDELEVKFIEKAKERVDIEKIIEERINDFDIEYLEEMTVKIAKKELKHIEVLGLFLGFMIGVVQGIITLFI